MTILIFPLKTISLNILKVSQLVIKIVLFFCCFFKKVQETSLGVILKLLAMTEQISGLVSI